VQALLHLVQIKMAGGEYAAAWDARNAVNRMREGERRRAEFGQLELPMSVVTVGELLGKQEREMNEMRLEQRRQGLTRPAAHFQLNVSRTSNGGPFPAQRKPAQLRCCPGALAFSQLYTATLAPAVTSSRAYLDRARP